MWGLAWQEPKDLGLLLGTPSTGLQGPSASLSSAEHPDGVILGRSPSHSSPWEEVLVSKIRDMLALEKSLVLEAVLHRIQEHSQVGPERPLCHYPLPLRGSPAQADPWLPLASAVLEALTFWLVCPEVPAGRQESRHKLGGQPAHSTCYLVHSDHCGCPAARRVSGSMTHLAPLGLRASRGQGGIWSTPVLRDLRLQGAGGSQLTLLGSSQTGPALPSCPTCSGPLSSVRA